MTHCPGCLRHVITDLIPALKYAGTWVPAFEICTWCGWVIKEVEPQTEETA